MRNGRYRRLALALLSGSILLQAPGCTETALGITSVATSITAGGLLYLIQKIYIG